MSNREKSLKGMECCNEFMRGNEDICKECPYQAYKNDDCSCIGKLHDDIFAIFKEIREERANRTNANETEE